jgi:hypothetical protein
VRRSKADRRAANGALDGWVLSLVAKAARESAPDEEAAFSAFLSEVAGDEYLSSMELARAVRLLETK